MFLGNTGIVCYHPVSLWQLQSGLERTYTCIHLSNVLTDHFSNSLSEKTTNDIPMKGGRALSPFFGPLQKPKYESYRTTISYRCFIS